MEAFEMINGKNVFEYWADRINGVNYNINPSVPLVLTYSEKASDNPYGYALSPVLGQTSSQIVSVKPELGALADLMVNGRERYTQNFCVAPLQYAPTFYNGETSTNYFEVLFRTPFISGSPISSANLYPNYVPGTQYVNVAEHVKVVDESDNTILSWVNGKLTLSDIAVQQYKLNINDVSVNYAFVKDAAYNTFAGQLTTGSLFGFDLPDPDTGVYPGAGIVTYNNNGATTVANYNLTVAVKVTFKDVAVVTVYVPFNVLVS